MASSKKMTDMEIPYCNLEAEQSVLGAILVESSILGSIIEVLPNGDYFYFQNHKLVYDTILEMFSEGIQIDYITVLERMKSFGVYEKIDFKTYLFDLAQGVPAISNAVAYAEIVKEKFITRNLLNISEEISSNINKNIMNITEILDTAEQQIFDLRSGKTKNGFEKIDSIIMKTLNKLDDLTSGNGKGYLGISTGICELDNVIYGLNKSDLILLAARPGMGKTTFALNIATHAAIKEGKKVAFFSLEMSKEQLASRLISSYGSISSKNLRSGHLNDDEWKKLFDISSALSKSQIYIDDTPAITIPEMKSRVRRLKDVDLVIVDYLQLMSSAKKIDNRVQEISEITRSLKIMAKELDIPLITLSQLSRASEQRNDHRPFLSDLRDSGSIEQDADIVMFLYREGYYQQSDSEAVNQNTGECIIAKNRHGEVTSVPLHWEGEFLRFTAVERPF